MLIYHKIKIEDNIIEETIENIRKRNGEYITILKSGRIGCSYLASLPRSMEMVMLLKMG
jgi:hypothetical protein